MFCWYVFVRVSNMFCLYVFVQIAIMSLSPQRTWAVQAVQRGRGQLAARCLQVG